MAPPGCLILPVPVIPTSLRLVAALTTGCRLRVQEPGLAVVASEAASSREEVGTYMVNHQPEVAMVLLKEEEEEV